MNDTTSDPPKLSWWRRLSNGLKRTSSSLGTAVHRQAGRFVDDQHQPVAMEHARQNLVGGQLGNIEQSQDFRSRLSFGSRNG